MTTRTAGFNGRAYHLGPNRTGTQWKLDELNQLEFYLNHNTPGQADGEVHVWLNGVKRHEYRAHRYDALDGSHNPGFAQILYEPIRGGAGGSKPQEEWLEIDDLYIRGR